MLTVLHSVIDDVGERVISIDDGFDKLIKLIFGFENYLPLDLKAKFHWLCSIAEITYAIMDQDYCCDEEVDYYYDMIMERCYTGSIFD